MLCESGRNTCKTRGCDCQTVETDLCGIVMVVVAGRVGVSVAAVVMMIVIVRLTGLMAMLVCVVMQLRQFMDAFVGMTVRMAVSAEMMMAEGEREFERQR